MILSFLDLPVINVTKSSQLLYSYVNNPNPVLLKCFANGRPAPNVFWKRSNVDTVVSNNSTYALIRPLRAQLDVTYQCFAKNKIGMSQPHSVQVKKIGGYGLCYLSAANLLELNFYISSIIPWTLNLPYVPYC